MASPRMADGIEIVNYRELEIQRVLGRGSFGVVYVARYNDYRVPNPVVIKQMHEQVDDNARKLFIKEAKLLNGIRHENIVRMHGICVNPLVIIMEYVFFDFKPFLNRQVKVNTVDKFLLEVSKLPKSEDRFDSTIPAIATDVTKGLSHLHHLGIAHRDLKPMNVLISNQHYCDLEDRQAVRKLKSVRPVICKLADFGESRSQLLQTNRVNDPGTNFGLRGTMLFLAPEILLPDGPIARGRALSLEDLKKVDIWALGQVFYCLLNPGISYPFEREGITNIPQLIQKQWQRQRPSADPGYQPRHTTVWSSVHDAFQVCTNHDPKGRPSASQVLDLLRSHRETAHSQGVGKLPPICHILVHPVTSG